MELSTAEWIAFGILLAACLGTLPALVTHVRGTSSHIDRAVQLMASSNHFQARLAGGMHLTWGNVYFGSLGVVFGAVGLPAARMVAGMAFLSAVVLDLSVFAVGRPSIVMLRRHRDAARRQSARSD